MDSLYFLIPISIVFVLLIGGVLTWAVMSGQFDGLEQEGRRILDEDRPFRASPGSDDPGGNSGTPT